jgi:hypothetical protein
LRVIFAAPQPYWPVFNSDLTTGLFFESFISNDFLGFERKKAPT